MFESDGWSGKVRMLPVNGALRSGWAGGVSPPGQRQYQATGGQTIDPVDADATALTSRGFFAVGASGPTASRPNNKYLRPGFLFVDTDLSLVVIFDGVDWRNPVSGATA